MTKGTLPHPPRRVPLLGDVLALDPRKPGQSVHRLAAELGPLFEMKVMRSHLSFLSSAELAAQVNNEKLWEKAVGPNFRRLRRFGGNGLILADSDDPAWAAAHRILMPGFTREAMTNYHPTMVVVIEELLDRWRATSAPIDIASDMNQLTAEIVARAGFGYSFFDDLREPVDTDLVRAMMGALAYANRPIVLPVLDNTIGRRARNRNNRNEELARRTAQDVIDNYRPGGQQNLLCRMLTVPDPETGELLSHENVRYQILNFLVAGHETSAGTLAFALHFLASRPGLVDRIRAETRQVTGGRPAATLSYDQVPKIRILRRIVDETLRLWPIAPGYFRKAKTRTTVGDHTYERGDWVFVDLITIHRDPQVWGPDADVFDPDRFLPEANRRRPPDAFKPFGTGLRACIGRQFALHEIALMLALTVDRYDITGDEDYELDVHELVTLKPNGLELRFTPIG